jgi:murein DD-endopeptidase MepM/ murein hydrolase activator NlpD
MSKNNNVGNLSLSTTVVTRFLLFCAVLLALPGIAAAQCISQLTIQRVWTQDSGGNDKTTFAPGETIQFVAELNNSYDGYLLAANGTQLTIATSFYNDTKPVDIPPGISTWPWNATAPSTEGSYTVTVKAYDHFCGVWPEGSASFTVGAQQSQLPPEITRVETFREGDLVFFRLFYTDPNNDATGFGFRGANGSGWAEATFPFSSPSFGRVSPGIVEYPFNHLCETGPVYESDVEAWIYDSAGLISPSVTVHLACTQFKFPWDKTITLKFTGGPHWWLSSSDPRSGVDFASGDTTQSTHVLAMADGLVTYVGDEGCILGNCKVVKVSHDTGLETWYVHLSSFAPGIEPNMQVSQGTWLGNEGSTGAPSVHIHIELRENGFPVSWDNRSIDGWTFHENCDGYNKDYNLTQPGADLAFCKADLDNNYDGYISRGTTHAVPIETPTPSTPQFGLESTNQER